MSFRWGQFSCWKINGRDVGLGVGSSRKVGFVSGGRHICIDQGIIDLWMVMVEVMVEVLVEVSGLAPSQPSAASASYSSSSS